MKLNRRFIKFIFIGVINTIFGLIAYTALIYFGTHVWIALITGNVAGVLFNFLTTGRFVFSSLSPGRFFPFTIVYLFCYLANYLLLRTLITFHLGPIESQIGVTPIMAALQFYLLSKHVFPSSQE